jgi:hypothetical protein
MMLYALSSDDMALAPVLIAPFTIAGAAAGTSSASEMLLVDFQQATHPATNGAVPSNSALAALRGSVYVSSWSSLRSRCGR